MPKGIKKKLTFKNDEFDDFHSANEDSDDYNYKPNNQGPSGAKRGRKPNADKAIEKKNTKLKVTEALKNIEEETEKLKK